MRAEGIKDNYAFFRLSVDPSDKSEVVHLKAGNFFLSFAKEGELLRPIVDPRVIFGEVSDFSFPKCYLARNFRYPAKQLTQGITPCAFVFNKARISPAKTLRVYSLFGHMRDINTLKQKIKTRH